MFTRQPAAERAEGGVISLVPHRVFLLRGTNWMVYDVRPATASLLAPAYVEGWLCFESASERRRLMPIPPDWEMRTDHELGELCKMSSPVRPVGANSHSAV